MGIVSIALHVRICVVRTFGVIIAQPAVGQRAGSFPDGLEVAGVGQCGIVARGGESYLLDFGEAAATAVGPHIIVVRGVWNTGEVRSGGLVLATERWCCSF